MAVPPELKLYETIFIETNLLSHDYDGVVLILYPKEKEVPLPRHIGSFVDNLVRIDKYIYSEVTVWNCSYVSGGRLVLSPTGTITPYHDVKVIYEAARKGIERALKAGIRKPLMVVQNVPEFPDSQLVAILGAYEALYVPDQIKKILNVNFKFQRLGLHAEEELSVSFERVVRNSIALERSRVFARDISGGDPEWMTPSKAVEFITQEFSQYSNVKINVINDDIIETEYPLLAAVSRGSTEKQRAKIIELTYKPSDCSRVAETLILIGKGVTYDTGGVDLKINGKMASSSRDKSGAGAVAGFLKACAILKPPHLKVIGVLCFCRNSIGHNSYVSDELIVSRSGKVVRVTNTDAEGRLSMADSLFKWTALASKELSPHIYTIATLTDHAISSFGHCTAAMDNHSARATKHALRLQMSGSRIDAINLFTKQTGLPEALRKMKYDPHSVMHFDQRAFSKNGHRTFLFRNKDFIQRKTSLTESDLRKIQLVYGDACVARDRQEKIDMCQNFVDVNDRKKRDLSSFFVLKSLRPNPNITPPPNITGGSQDNIDLDRRLDSIVEQINEITNQTLDFLQGQLCNGTEPLATRRTEVNFSNSSTAIKEALKEHLITTVHNITANRTEFCKRNDSLPSPTCAGDTCKMPEIENPPRVKRNSIVDPEFEFDATFNIHRKSGKAKFRNRRTNKSGESSSPASASDTDDGEKVHKEDEDDENDEKNDKEEISPKQAAFRALDRSDDELDDDESNPNGALRLSKSNEGFYEDRRWPNGVVPYMIDENMKSDYNVDDVRQRIEEVNKILKRKTCVKLVPIEEGKHEHKDYLVLNTNEDYVTGHVGGRQEFGSLELFNGGQHRQHAAMMVMAMLGFYFEVSRHDRDEYIRVHDRHIRPDKLHHFEKIKEDATLDLPYDYESATHPSWQFWRTVGRKGASSVATYKNMDPSGEIMKGLGQNEKLLSDLDIVKINAVYNCK